jgi:uncharacterized protein DUF4390
VKRISGYPHPGRSTRLIRLWVAAALGCIPSSVQALGVRVSAPGEAFPLSPTETWTSPAHKDSLVAAFRVEGTFDANASLGDGIAATLLIVVDLWQERSGWWDSLVRSKVLLYRFRRDVWTGQVELLDQAGSPRQLPDRDALRANLERLHEIGLGTPGDFAKGKSYYLSVKAMLRPLSLDDLENVDAWLSGKVTGSEGGGILGIPKSLARAVIGASGLGDESAIGRSAKFMPRP